MKRILLSIALASAALAPAVAAEPASNNAATETFYIQLVSRSRITERGESFASLETGREFVQITGMSESLAARIGKRRFPSLLDGLNKLAVNGWRLADASSTTHGGVTVTTWTLAKTVADRSELLDGLAE